MRGSSRQEATGERSLLRGTRPPRRAVRGSNPDPSVVMAPNRSRWAWRERTAQYMSELMISLLAMVDRPHQAYRLMEFLMKRTLPSHIPMLTPPG